MADRRLENLGVMSGVYAGTTFANSVSSEVEVVLADVPFLKTADQSIWFSGELTYTFTVDNTSGAGTLDTIIITDLLDNTKFKYIADSVVAQLETTVEPIVVTPLVLGTDFTVVYVEDVPEETDKDSLTISFLTTGAAASIPVGSKAIISFRGTKVEETP